MVRQATNELAKRIHRGPAEPAKAIELSVGFLRSKYVFSFFASTIRYTAKLGSGKTLEKEVGHGHADQISDLNGAIAEGGWSC